MAIGDNLSSDSVNRSSAQMASLDAATRPISSTTTASELETAIQERAMALALRMLNNQMNATTLAGSGRIFTPFNQSTDVVENQKTLVTLS